MLFSQSPSKILLQDLEMVNPTESRCKACTCTGSNCRYQLHKFHIQQRQIKPIKSIRSIGCHQI